MLGILYPQALETLSSTKRLNKKTFRLFTMRTLNCLKFRDACLSRVIWQRHEWMTVDSGLDCCSTWWFCGSATLETELTKGRRKNRFVCDVKRRIDETAQQGTTRETPLLMIK